MVCYAIWDDNSPSTFMSLMNEILKPFLGKKIVVYLDDIIIFCKIKEEHLEEIREVLQELNDKNLLINLKKCAFM